MKSYLAMVGMLLLWPAVVVAQPQGKPKEKGKAAESLLPASSVVYFRFDGIEPHRKAYEQTALAEVMKGDLGEFLEYLGAYLKETLKKDAEERQEAIKNGYRALAEQTLQVMGWIGRKGVVVGLEVSSDTPARVQLTLVFPESAAKKDRDVLFGVLRTLAEEGLPVKEKKRGKRSVFEVKFGEFQAGWWQEGNHVVC